MRTIIILSILMFYGMEGWTCSVELYPKYIKINRASISSASDGNKKI